MWGVPSPPHAHLVVAAVPVDVILVLPHHEHIQLALHHPRLEGVQIGDGSSELDVGQDLSGLRTPQTQLSSLRDPQQIHG